MSAVADKNLLFGIVALQMDFIGRDALVAAMHAWVADKTKSLGEILVAQQALTAQRHAMLMALVDEHIKQHGDNPQQSLQSMSSMEAVRSELAQIADPDVQTSLSQMPTGDAGDDGEPPLERTMPLSAVTSSGNRFRFLRPWREGGLGKVSIAQDAELRREVALKEIKYQHSHSQHSRDRFLLEAEVTGSLEHPGIVPVYGLGRYGDGRPFYAMRFIRGDSLEEAIERFHKGAAQGATEDAGERSVAFRELLGRFVDVCNAMAYAHSRGVLHRDLKPGNIILGKYGETLIVDWGLAKVQGKVDESSSVQDEAPLELQSASGSAPTRMGSLVGTPMFMSPEQANGRLDLVGPASDVYSLGATLYVLISGVAPFSDQDVNTLLTKVRSGEFPRPMQVNKEIAPALDAICVKAMSLEPVDRYPTPMALADDLEHYLADEPVTAYREPLRERAQRWVRRHRSFAMATALALLLVTAVSVVATVLVNHQRVIADAARRSADTSFREARDAVDDLFTSVSEESLLNQPGMQGLRRNLLEKALVYYDRFLQQRADDPSVREEYGITLFRAGRLLDELRSPEDAIPKFQQAIEIQTKLLGEMPDSAQRMQALGDTQNSLGRSLYRGRHLDQAATAYEAGRVLRQKLVDLTPTNSEFQRGLANSLMNLGMIEQEHFYFDAAAEKFQAAQKIRETQLAANDQNPKLQRDLAMGAFNQGNLAVDRQQLAAAEEYYSRAIQRFEILHDKSPNDLSIQFLLATCYRRLGDVLATSSPDKSNQMYESAREALTSLADRSPDVGEYQAALAAVYMNIGFRQESSPASAAASFAKARTLLDRLVQQSPQNSQFRRDLATSLRELGCKQMAINQEEAGLNNLRSSVKLLEKLIDEFPQDKGLIRELETSRESLDKGLSQGVPARNA